MRGRSGQKGISLIGWLAIIVVAVFVGTCALKLVPIYAANWTVNSVLSSVASEPESASRSAGELRRAINARFQTNRVDVISARDISISQRGGVMVIDASYEVREPLMFNIDVVVRFDDLVHEVPRR